MSVKLSTELVGDKIWQTHELCTMIMLHIMSINPRPIDELFREVTALRDLPSTDLTELGAAAELRNVARGGVLFGETQQAEGLFLVRTGELKVTKTSKDGREQIVYLARPGKAIVEGVRFDGGSYGVAAVAMRPASLFLILNPILSRVAEKRPHLLRAFVDLRARRADRTYALIADLSLRTVPARLASFLCTLAAARQARGEDPCNLVRDLTTETVAGRLGTVREEISRGLASLERAGALRVTPDLIEICDSTRLEKIAYGSRRN